MMQLSERIQSLKPYAGGAVIGIVAVTIVAFSADWIVMKSTMDSEVRAAQISALAVVCQQNAGAHWQNQGKELAALEGWRNDERKKLAEQFAPAFANGDYREAIVDRCDSLLRPA